MKNTNLFEKDFKSLNEFFPKLSHKNINQANNAWLITGEIDICDSVGDYWDTFSIIIIVPFQYPFCIPIVLETSEKIKRIEDHHIDEHGICCLDITHKMLLLKARGINLLTFTREKIYPFFVNQVYFEKKGKFANGEYKHHFEGIKQYYAEDLKINSVEECVMILKHLLNDTPLTRNDFCFCKRKLKYKKCHHELVEILKSIDESQLQIDLIEFEKELNAEN